MAKKVISIRLSEEQLAKLDFACKQLRLNRSEVFSEAIELLPKIIGTKDKQIKIKEIYLSEPWMGGEDEG